MGTDINTEGGAVMHNVQARNFVNRDYIYNKIMQAPEISLPTKEQIDAGIKQFKAMPVKEIPESFSIPPNSHLGSNTQDDLFVGRENFLKKIASAFQNDELSNSSRNVAITGMDGIGKTKLALNFAHRYGKFFVGGVYFLNMADATNITSEVVKCGTRMSQETVPDYVDWSVDKRQAYVTYLWQSELPRLLIFNDCETPELFKELRPQMGGCRILITSRYNQWDPTEEGVQRLTLDTFDRKDSIELLRKYREDISEETEDYGKLDKLAKIHGDLPLALKLVGKRLKQKSDDLDEYLVKLEVSDGPLSDTSRILAHTFSSNYEELDSDDSIDRLAIDVLACAVCFAPDEPIERNLLQLAIERFKDNKLDEPDHFYSSIRRLNDLGLLQLDNDGNPVVHLLMADFVINSISRSSDAQIDVEEVVLLQARKLNEQGIPKQLLQWQNHLTYITEQALQRQAKRAAALIDEEQAALADEERTALADDARAAALASALGQHFHLIGAYSLTKLYYEKSLKIRETLSAKTHIDEATSQNNLGIIFMEMGELESAEKYLREALSIREERLLYEHRHTAFSRNNLGRLYQKKGDFAKAKPLLEQALRDCQAAKDHSRSETALSLHNLGSLSYALGELQEAKQYLTEAFKIRKEIHKEKHPDTAHSLNDLGSVLRALGEISDAKVHLEDALEIRVEILGEEHPDTASSLNNLGTLLREMGESAKARPYLEKSLQIRQEVLPKEHTEIASSLTNLGTLLQEIGETEKAKLNLQRAVEIYEHALGEHPSTARSLSSLGFLLQETEELKKAKKYHERALSIREQMLGKSHPDTARSLINLGMLFKELQEFEQAKDNLDRALDITMSVLGDNHPDTAACFNNLGLIVKEMGRFVDAKHYLQRSLDIRRQILGEKHPDTATSLNNLGSLLQDMGTYDEAAPLIEQALEIRKEVLGIEHPQTARSFNNLGLLLEQQDRIDDAKPYLVEALRIAEKLLDREHPHTQLYRENFERLGEILSVAEVFRPIYDQIRQSSLSLPIQSVLNEQIFKLETEVKNNDKIDTQNINDAFTVINSLGTDILNTTTQILGNPTNKMPMAIQTAAQQMNAK